MIIPVLLINIIIVGYQICQRKETIPLIKTTFLKWNCCWETFSIYKTGHQFGTKVNYLRKVNVMKCVKHFHSINSKTNVRRVLVPLKPVSN